MVGVTPFERISKLLESDDPEIATYGYAVLNSMIREEHPRVGDLRLCPCGCGGTQHYTGTEHGWCNETRSTDGRA